MITLDIWEGEGAFNHHLSPVYTYNNPADINNKFLGGVTDENGRCYYISYPPMAFVAPYLAFTLTGQTPTPFGLAVFSIFLHLVSALLIMLIINRLYNKPWREGIFVPALVASGWYLLAAGNMHYYASNFFSDVMLQPFLLFQVYFLIRWLDHQSKSLAWGIAIMAFLGIYTEYQAVFQAAVVFLVALFWIKGTSRWRLPALLVLAGILSLGVTFWQYSSIAGSEEMISALSDKYAERSGIGAETEVFTWKDEASWNLLEEHFTKSYTFANQCMILLLLLAIVMSVIAGVRLLTKKEGVVLLVVGLPILMHYVIFFNFNALHDFGSLKIAVPITLLIGMASAKIADSFDGLLMNFKWIGSIVILGIVALKMPKNLDAYDNIQKKLINPSMYVELGETIQQKANPDELVFVEYFHPWPVVMYYSKRNVNGRKSLPEAQRSMKWFPEGRALYVGMQLYIGMDTVAYIYGKDHPLYPGGTPEPQ